MLKYAYANAHTWLMQLHLTFLSLSITCNLIFYTWSLGGEWPLSPLGNSCFSRPSLFLYMSVRFTFPNPHTGLFSLNLVRDWPKFLDNTTLVHYEVEARYIPLQLLIVFLHSWLWSCMHMLYVLMHMLDILLSNIIACMISI